MALALLPDLSPQGRLRQARQYGMIGQMLSAADVGHIRSIVETLPRGRSGGVRTVSSQPELETIWREISYGGQTVGSTYPGTLIQLPDGTFVGGRGRSTSGGPTIDIKLPDGTRIKIRIHPWK